MKIKINNNLYLSEINKNDRLDLIKYLNNYKIYRNTLRIPYPYTIQDADWWISFVDEQKKLLNKTTHFAIRDKNNKILGGIGFNNKYGPNFKKDEIGYWLAEEYWNQGIMTEVVKKICEIGFKEFKLDFIEATIFEDNDASGRVLEKAGFYFKEYLKDYYDKDGNKISGRLYEISKKVWVNDMQKLKVK